MCRIVGIVFRDALNMASFRDVQHVAELGKVPEQGDELPGHRDGWGIASFRGGSPRYEGRSERPMHLDPSYDSALSNLSSLHGPNIVIVHARRGSEGSRSLVNTHPFISDGIVFAHNGTVKDFHPSTSRIPKGQTDSERLFMRLLDIYGEKRDLGGAIKSLVREDVSGHEYTAVIMMISDGKSLYGYRGYGKEEDSWYYGLKASLCPDTVTLFQETVQGYAGEVRELKDGELVRVSMDLETSFEKVL